GGDVVGTQVLAGYDTVLSAVDGNAGIGGGSVGRDWVASDLVAGVRADDNPNPPNVFGDANDEPINLIGGAPGPLARIGSVAIGGVVAGTAEPADHFGFVAQRIGSFRARGAVAPPTTPLNPPRVHLSPPPS